MGMETIAIAAARPAPDWTPDNTGRSALTMRGRHPEWKFNGVLPVLVVWLVFYVITIIGSPAETRPTSMAPVVAPGTQHATAANVQ
jgi:hypothetical protein